MRRDSIWQERHVWRDGCLCENEWVVLDETHQNVEGVIIVVKLGRCINVHFEIPLVYICIALRAWRFDSKVAAVWFVSMLGKRLRH